MIRRASAGLLTLLASLALGSGVAQAVVVDMNAVGQTSVQFNSSARSGYYGVALLPSERTAPNTIASTLSAVGVPYVTSSGLCEDPALTFDLFLPDTGICFHGGPVMHSNETFALTWDAKRLYWAGTRGYVEQFLRDVADGSGRLSSPFAVTTQYTDSTGRAQNRSKYGGGCIDYGNPTNSSLPNTTCLFGSSVHTGPGHNYPTGACAQSGTSWIFSEDAPNLTCLTDAQLRNELRAVITQTGILGRTQTGYTPMVAVLMPPQIEVCLDAAGTLCSANSAATARFCSYHARVNVNTPSGPREVAYVVQPWTVNRGCDDPSAPAMPNNPTPATLARNMGLRLVSPLSQGLIGSIVNPALNGWFALDGSEIDDNYGCLPLGNDLDRATVGSSSQNPYLLQREFNNAGVIESDPSTYFGCAPNVLLTPNFVVPSAVNQGDVLEFDGSSTTSTLIVPASGYHWTFGDGTSARGASVTHSYARAGSYRVTLTVTDRGGNVRHLSQTIQVLRPDGQPAGSPSSSASHRLRVRLQLLPQSLSAVLHHGMAVRVSSNQRADGFTKLLISASAARRAHIHVGRAAMVVIGRGTVSGITAGTVSRRVHLSSAVAGKLAHLHNVTLTLRLELVGAAGGRVNIEAAGRY